MQTYEIYIIYIYMYIYIYLYIYIYHIYIYIYARCSIYCGPASATSAMSRLDRTQEGASVHTPYTIFVIFVLSDLRRITVRMPDRRVLCRREAPWDFRDEGPCRDLWLTYAQPAQWDSNLQPPDQQSSILNHCAATATQCNLHTILYYTHSSK